MSIKRKIKNWIYNKYFKNECEKTIPPVLKVKEARVRKYKAAICVPCDIIGAYSPEEMLDMRKRELAKEFLLAIIENMKVDIEPDFYGYCRYVGEIEIVKRD